jgi:hypothetical protein
VFYLFFLPLEPQPSHNNPPSFLERLKFPVHITDCHYLGALQAKPTFREPPTGEVRRMSLPRARVNKLIGQLLQGPAVPVRIAEVGMKNAPEILDLADIHSSLDELRTRRRYVRNDQE